MAIKRRKKNPRIAAATVRKGQSARKPVRRRNTGAFDFMLSKIRERSVEDIGGRERMIEIVAGDLSFESHTPIQAQRELIKAGMNRKSAGALVRKAQTFNRLAAQRNPSTKTKAKAALKTTGRALKGAARSLLSAGAGLLESGAAALNPGASDAAMIRATVRDLIRSGRNLKEIVSLMRQSGFTNAQLKQASKVYAREAKEIRETGMSAAERRLLNPGASDAAMIRKDFAGSVSGSRDLYFPEGTPQGLAVLGELVSIETELGTIKPTRGKVFLCADTHGKLHLGCTVNAPLWNETSIANRNLGRVGRLEWMSAFSKPGVVDQIEYSEKKPHLGYKNKVIWYHRMGEETGEKPTLYADGKGGLRFRGGRYRITREGIVN